MPEGKIKSKDLTYESTLPPFLQRLHAQKAGRGDQDRHEQPIARPTRAKTNDEDDGPTVVDESGETVSKEEYEKLTKAGTGDEAADNIKGEATVDEEPKGSGAIQDSVVNDRKGEQKVTDGTAVKKRKVAKVVGDDDVDDVEEANDADGSKTAKSVKKAKKKAKPIKLAFDDGDG